MKHKYKKTIVESKNDITSSVIDENAPIKIKSVEQSGYVRKGDETIFVAYNVSHEEQTKVDEELIKKMSESLKDNYVETFPNNFPDGIKSYEVIEVTKYVKENYTNAILF